MANNTIDVLETLIETCRDGQAGYRDAAEHTQNAELKEFFSRQSLERAKFSGELESVVQRLGEPDPDRGPSISNKLHRAWFDLKQKLGGGDVSILESVEAGEDNAKKHYQDALNATLPGDVKSTVERQAQSVLATHDRVRSLRDQYKKAA
ncbi:MAG TPA: PA2169 family four-helix-bundle protein [Candidatus Saccharimonadales bacterium]|nr:PA2169 family four-helix-bundle protein [Candidatus Saccharimonadales bacterium]